MFFLCCDSKSPRLACKLLKAKPGSSQKKKKKKEQPGIDNKTIL